MVARTLTIAAWVCSLLVVASFVLFVHDQLASGSQHQVALVSSTAVPVSTTTHQRGQPRRFIDGAAHDLLSPFASIVPSDSPWVVHGIPTLIALVVYGGGLGFAARFTRGLG
ncbi:MAG TPA: hypothetical protein VG223_17075 [Solirubrobacteraceae bacterium]|nr:hypothetical protein [Solirubrobacteraceae bacterium]